MGHCYYYTEYHCGRVLLFFFPFLFLLSLSHACVCFVFLAGKFFSRYGLGSFSGRNPWGYNFCYCGHRGCSCTFRIWFWNYDSSSLKLPFLHLESGGLSLAILDNLVVPWGYMRPGEVATRVINTITSRTTQTPPQKEPKCKYYRRSYYQRSGFYKRGMNGYYI